MFTEPYAQQISTVIKCTLVLLGRQ